MKTSIKTTQPCERTISVRLEGETVREALARAFGHIAKHARVPGFRPGHVPRHVLEMHFKDEARERAIKDLIRESLAEALKAHQVSPIGYPGVDDISFKDDQLDFKIVVEVAPEIKKIRYKGLKAKREPVKVEERDLEDLLTRYREQHARFKPVDDRAAQMGDYLIADYELRVNGSKIDSRKGDWFELADKEYLQGFSKQLVGARAGESRKVSVKLPQDFPKAEVRGKDAFFDITIREIKLKELPEPTDEWAKEVGAFDSLALFKDKLRQDLQRSKEREAEVAFEKQLLDDLVKSTRFDVPRGAVERRVASLVEEGSRTLTLQGFGEEAVSKRKPELAERLRPEAERQVRIAFLLEEVARLESLTATDMDLESRYAELAQRFKQPVEKVRDYYQGRGDVEVLKQEILNEKAFQCVKDNANAK